VHAKKVMDHAALCSDLRSQKSCKRPLSFEQRSAMALEPGAVQCMQARLRRPMAGLDHAGGSTQALGVEFGIAHPLSVGLEVMETAAGFHRSEEPGGGELGG
jgi:hypothetical protein